MSCLPMNDKVEEAFSSKEDKLPPKKVGILEQLNFYRTIYLVFPLIKKNGRDII